MKKIVLILSVALIAVACSSNEEKAQTLVTNFLKTKLDDFSRYEPVSWGTLDSAINTLNVDTYYLGKIEAIKMYKGRVADIKALHMLRASAELDVSEEALLLGTESRLAEEEKSLETYITNFKEGFVGWRIKHTYRAPNKVGALELHERTFLLNKDITEVQ